MTYNNKEVRGDKIWRSLAIIVLCLLVYYFSYDQGRQSMVFSQKSFAKQAANELENQSREIMRLQAALSACGRTVPGEETPSVKRFPLRVNQSKIIFDGRLVVTLLELDHDDNKARIQLNFIEEERLAVENLVAGGSLRFSLDGHNWAVVASALSLSTATLNLVELKESAPSD